MESLSKPACKFGVKCYRKNPEHFDTYSHPGRSSVKNGAPVKNNHTLKLRTKSGKRAHNSFNGRTEQTASREDDFSSPIESDQSVVGHEEKRIKFDGGIKNIVSNRNSKPVKSTCEKSKRKRKDSLSEASVGSAPSISSVSIKDTSSNTRSRGVNVNNKTREEIIKTLFLVDMPPDFYSFYEFYKSVAESHQFQVAELKLAGPFNVLSGELDYTVEQDLFLCHSRYYYDPPEFQTVLITDSGFHIGYWRDDPKENPVFLASNNPNKNCIFKVEAENIFGTVFHYLNDFFKNTDPFKKVKIARLQNTLSNWAKENNFSLERQTAKMDARQKKVVSKTFHGAGIVVPVENKTDVGYRPLIETDANLKKICNLIMKANDNNERETLWDNLQPLVNAANIANDECDFGNGLELGIDLFCMGSPVFHETVEHLLSTAYSLLNRSEFEKIIRSHLKYRSGIGFD